MIGDNFDIGTSGNRQKMTVSEYLKYGGLAVLFLLFILLYVLEFKYFNLALGIKPLVFGSLIVGFLIGVGLGFLFSKSAEDLTDRVQVYAFFILLCTIFMPLFGSLSNRLLSFQKAQPEQVEFVEQSPFYASRLGVIKGEKIQPTGYNNFFYRNNKLYRVKTSERLFSENLEKGDSIDIPIKKGLWGIAWVQL